MKKRILSMLLCVMMVVTAIPLALVPTVAADVEEAAAPTITYDDLYVPGATYKWDAFDLTAEDGAVDAFTNQKDTGLTLPLKGTAYDKYVRSTTGLNVTNLIESYTSDDGNKYILYKDVTIEVVAKQIYDEEFAAVMSAGTKRMTWKKSLIGRYASDGTFEFVTQVPTKGENGEWTNGLIKSLSLARRDPVTADSSKGFGNVAWIANVIDDPYSFGWSFAFDPTNEYPQFTVNLLRDSAVKYTTNYQYQMKTSKQEVGLSVTNNDLCFGYYAIRAYGEVLTEAEMQQNHFADLAKYFAISDTALLSLETLPEEYILELHTAFTAVNFNDTNKDAFEAAIAEKQAAYDEYLAEQEALRVIEMREALYVDDATYMWDAFDLTAGDSVSSFANSVGTTNLAMSGTAGNKYVRVAKALNLSALLPQYKAEDGTYVTENVTFEIVLHQHWDENSTFDVTDGKQHLGTYKGNTLLKRYAEGKNAEGYLEWRTQDPTATGNKYPGFIKYGAMTTVKPDGSGNPSNWNSGNASGSIGQFYENELNEPFAISFAFDFDCANEYPQFDVTLYRADTGLNATRTSKYFNTVAQKFDLFPASFTMGYYAIRAYNKVLNADELNQNHFADLANYFEIGAAALDVFNAFDSESKLALYTSLATVNFNDTDKAGVENAIFAIKEQEDQRAYEAALKALYVDGATYMWDAFDAVAGTAYTAFVNTVGDTDLTIKGTAGDGFVRAQATLDLSALIPSYTAADGSGLIYSKDVTFEIVMHQHWDDAYAAHFAGLAGAQRFVWGNTLITRNAEALSASGALEWRTHDPFAEGHMYPGYINYAEVAVVDPVTNKASNFGTGSSYGSVGQFYENELNEPFAIAYAFAFDCENEYPQFDLTVYRGDTGVNRTATTKYRANTSAQAFKLFNADMAFGYYAIRAYDRVLSETELQQNHFADLANYFEISVEMIELLKATPAEKLAAFYAAYDEVNFNDTTPEEFEASITANLAAVDAAIVKGEAAKDSFITFDGYQVRTNGYAGIRSRYTVALDAIVEGATLVEVGAIMAIATEGRTTADLTVVKTADGYTATGKQMMNAAVKETDVFTDETGAHFAYTLTFQNEASQTKTNYETEILFRGYVVLEIDGFEYVYYTDMTSVFGESISMLEASQHEAFKDYTTSQAVIAACAE